MRLPCIAVEKLFNCWSEVTKIAMVPLSCYTSIFNDSISYSVTEAVCRKKPRKGNHKQWNRVYLIPIIDISMFTYVKQKATSWWQQHQCLRIRTGAWCAVTSLHGAVNVWWSSAKNDKYLPETGLFYTHRLHTFTLTHNLDHRLWAHVRDCVVSGEKNSVRKELAYL